MMRCDPEGLTDGERWYAVSALPKREDIAITNLHKQGYRSFMPRIRKTIRHARQRRTVLAPFFPGYLFVPLDLERDRWRSINGTYGVASMIMAGERPRPVPRGVVEGLQAIVDDRGLVDTHQGLEIGEKVRILTGAFAEHVGVLATLPENNRVRVLLEFMGGERAVTISRDTIVAADRSSSA
jgi:transcription elongation factor/antiterminator RfaH